MLDLKAEIRDAWIGWIFSTTREAMDKKNQLTAMAIAADGLIAFASRHADALAAGWPNRHRIRTRKGPN
jgi:hypothetical protein